MSRRSIKSLGPLHKQTTWSLALVHAFRTGDVIETSGIYRVVHYQHRLPHEVTLLQGGEFPPCAKCGTHVWFELLREVQPFKNGSTRPDFGVRLHSIPELPVDRAA